MRTNLPTILKHQAACGNPLLFFGLLLLLQACEDTQKSSKLTSSSSETTATATATAVEVIKTSTPSTFLVSNLSSTSISFTWINTASGIYHTGVEMCEGVDCREYSGSSALYIPLITTHTVSGLKANTAYNFRLKSTGPLGESSYLESGNVFTLHASNNGLVVNNITSSTIDISWVNNLPTTTGVQIQRCNGAACTNFNNTFSSPLAAGTTSYLEMGLNEYSTYRLRLRNLVNSSFSDWLTSSDIMTLPMAPSSVVGTAAGSTSINLTWADNSAAETGFQIQRCLGSTCTNFADVNGSPVAANVTTFSDSTGLSAESSYLYRVRALTAGNSSTFSNSTRITTLPAAPTAINVTSLSDTALSFSWNENSSSELFYELQSCSGLNCSNFATATGSPLAANSTVYSISSLSPSTNYSYRLRSVNTDGSSSWLTYSNVKTAPAKPSAFTNGTIGGTSIQFTWTDNASDETSFQIQKCTITGCSNFADVSSSPSANVVTFTETGLSSNTTYRFRIRAVRDSVYSDWLTSSDITTSVVPVAVASCASPKTRVLDSGVKGIVAGVQRGLWSDTKIIPGSQNPAVAFYDGSTTGGSASIKLSYWTGSRFITESVSIDTIVAAGSATWVKLAFLTNGIPLIIWSTGAATLKAAIRSAAFSNSAGTWTSAIIDSYSGAVNRAVSVSVSPNNDVAVAYFTNSSVAGRVRFVYCAACTSLSGFVAMGSAASDNIENTATAVNIMKISVGWCNNAGTYIPAVAYHGNAGANFRYAVCPAPLSSCSSPSGWTTKTNIVAAAAPVGIDMIIDPSISQDIVKIVSKNAAGSALNAYYSTTGCHSPGSFTAGVAIGATTAGTAWFNLLKDASGFFHVVANDALTSVVYMNSLTSSFTTPSWNAAGTVETVTLPAVGAGAGGAAINTTGIIYASYGLNAAPFNLNLGVVNDATIASNSANAVYYTVIPDNSGSINVPLSGGNQARNVALASTSSNLPAVAYIDHSVGTLAAGRLKYKLRSGTSADSAWSSIVVPNTTSPLFPGLAFDHNNLPWISYYDSGNFRYYLATNSSSDGTGTWTQYQVPLGSKTATATAPATDDTSVAMYYSSGIAQPVIIFINSTANGGTGVRAVRLDPSTGKFGNVVTIDALGAAYATRLTSDFDSNGNIVIAYYDIQTTTVKYNYTSNGGTYWLSPTQISAATVGREGLSIKINPSNSRPAVSYYQKSSNNVYYNNCTTSIGSCGLSNNWTQSTAQSASAVGVSAMATTVNEQVLSASLAFGSTGVPYISYMTGISPSGMNPALVMADSATGFTPTLPTVLLTSGPTLTGASPISFGQQGMNVRSLINGLGQVINVHVGANNWLYSTTCGD